jgi:hypothetical protein
MAHALRVTVEELFRAGLPEDPAADGLLGDSFVAELAPFVRSLNPVQRHNLLMLMRDIKLQMQRSA